MTGIFRNTREEGNDPLRLLKRLARSTSTTDLLRGQRAEAVRPEDVFASKRAGTRRLAFTTHEVPLAPRWVSGRDELRRAKRSRRLDGRSALALAGPRREHLWPVDPYQETPRALQSLAWTTWPRFTVGMVQRGRIDDTIRKILGGNVLRVWSDNTPAQS